MQSFLRMVGLSGLLLSGVAHADTLLVDRGLPTTNLNNVSGDNRSNVTWAFTDGYFAGDTFTLGGAAGTIYTITELQTWVTSVNGAPLSATLYTGIGANANLVATNTAPSFTSVTYADGQTYQGTAGSFRPVYLVDFTGLNIVAAAGATISFGVDGVSPGSPYFFNHASNAALSGSPQDGADNAMSYYFHDGLGATYDGVFDSNGNGWDKSSDINVRVFGTAAVPEPATWGLMIAGFGLVGGAMRRRRTGVAFA